MFGWYREDESWQDYAKCRGVDPDLYFPDKRDAEESYKITRPICAGCPVQDECREYALGTNQTEGMWGGMSANELRRERKRRLHERKNNGDG